MSEKHEAIIWRYYHDLFGTGRMEMKTIDQYMAADFVAHDLPLAQKGCEDYKRFIGMYGASFSDIHHIINDIFSCGDRVVARWSWAVKHTAEFMGIPATNRQITIKGIDIYRLTDGEIANLWQEIDMMGILQQISAPPPGGNDKESISRRS